MTAPKAFISEHKINALNRGTSVKVWTEDGDAVWIDPNGDNP